MILLLKQRMFSWFDSYDIYDEAGNTVFVVKGELAWGHCMRIYDAIGNELGMIKQKILTFMPKFEISMNNMWEALTGSLTFLPRPITLIIMDGMWKVISGNGIMTFLISTIILLQQFQKNFSIGQIHIL